jgi:hypothetical protein
MDENKKLKVNSIARLQNILQNVRTFRELGDKSSGLRTYHGVGGTLAKKLNAFLGADPATDLYDSSLSFEIRDEHLSGLQDKVKEINNIFEDMDEKAIDLIELLSFVSNVIGKFDPDDDL